MLYRIGNIRHVPPCLGEAVGTSHEVMSGVEDRPVGSGRQPAYPHYGDVDRKEQSVGIGHDVDERRLRGRERTRESTAKVTGYCASTQVSDPVSLAATFEKKIRSGWPSAVPRWSVEMSRGPAFL